MCLELFGISDVTTVPSVPNPHVPITVPQIPPAIPPAIPVRLPKDEKIGDLYKSTMDFARPALALQQATSDLWTVSAIVVTKTHLKDPKSVAMYLSSNPKSAIIPDKILDHRTGQEVWRYRMPPLPRKDVQEKMIYRIADYQSAFFVPPKAKMPNSIYFSCNDLQTPEERAKNDYIMPTWKKVLKLHKRDHLELLEPGGDQLYNDGIFELPEFLEFAKAPDAEGEKMPFTENMKRAARDYFFQRYLEQWNRKQLSKVFSRVPTAGMADDHDYFDGWGSYTEKLQTCAVYQGIYVEGRRAFLAFQLHGTEGHMLEKILSNQPTLTQIHEFGEAALLTFDTRSCRTQHQILPKETWVAIRKVIEELNPKIKHLLMAVSIPVAFPHFYAVREILAIIPGRQELEDDLDDQWRAVVHHDETQSFVKMMQELAVKKSLRITLLSGDVHIGALTKIYSGDDPNTWKADSIANLVSSPSGNEVVPRVMELAIEMLGNSPTKMNDVSQFALLNMPNNGPKLLRDQNFIHLKTESSEIQATYYTTHSDTTYTFKIPAVTSSVKA